jgi:hypothetical protein
MSAHKKDAYISMKIAEKFIIATLCNQLRCPSSDE